MNAKPLSLARLDIADVRNIATASIEPAARINVISGNNGHGKTSLLEAIYALATSRSFRTQRTSELVRDGRAQAGVRGRFVERWSHGPLGREQSLLLRGARRELSIDGESPASLAHYATRSPVVVFEPKQLSLSQGPASERRTLLDRLTLFADPATAMHRARYRRALKERQLLLGRRAAPAEIDAYERILAEHGAALTRARAAAVDALREPLLAAFARIAEPGLSLGVSYAPGGSAEPAEALLRLCEGRGADAQRRRTGFGPHQDDVELTFGGRPVRAVGSQGQHRALTLALKSGELDCIAAARGVAPILLLDDVSSELDADRTAALFEHLAATDNQIFLTTTRRELIAQTAIDRADFRMERGIIRAFREG